MQNELSKVLSYYETQGKHYIYHDGFVFAAVTEPANVYDGIVIRCPETAKAFSPLFGYSDKTLQEHIDFVNKYQLEKAIIFADSIDFITQCSSLRYIKIFPSDCAANNFDYSPLYNMPEIKYLECRTIYDLKEDRSTTVDYSQIAGLKHLHICGKGHLNVSLVNTLETLHIQSYKTCVDLVGICSGENLKCLDVVNCSLRSLTGLENLGCLETLSLSCNRNLQNIDALEKVIDSLRILSIESCSKISDFTVLDKLENLEYLELYGKNELKDLSFLNKMKKLKFFAFSMNVLNGDLTPCHNIEYVRSEKNRKHYNLKDKDLPKKLNNN